MTKVTLADLSSTLSNTAASVINANNAVLEAALENTLSRNGSVPNTMEADLDMNSHRILNLLNAVSAREPVTFQQMEQYFGERDNVSAKDCGAVGDGNSHPLSEIYESLENAQAVYPFVTSLDQELDWAGITLSLNQASTTGSFAYLDSGNYIVSTAISVPSNTNWYGPGCLKARDGSSISVVSFAGASDVFISIRKIDGNKDNCPSGGQGIVSSGSGSSRITIRDVEIFNCKQNGILVQASNYTDKLLIENCYVHNNDYSGISLGAYVKNSRIISNHAADNLNHGIGMIGVAYFVVIANNVAENNGPNSDNFSGYNYLNSDILVSNNISIGGKNHGIHFGGSRVSYVGNISYGTVVGNGIRHGNNTAAIDTDVMIVGNLVSTTSALMGIYVEKATSVVITGNTVCSTASSGIYATECSDLTITGNTARANAFSGIQVGASSNVIVSSNMSLQNSQRGLYVSSIDGLVVSANNCRGNTLDGIRTGGTLTNSVFSGNVCTGNGAAGIQSVGSTDAKFIGNVLSGNTTYGFVAGSSASGVELDSNILSGNTSGALNYSTGLSQFTRIDKNKGYNNPVGVSSVTVGSSPFTYTAGPTYETLYITGGTISSITLGGTAVFTSTDKTVNLAPGQSAVITYSSLPTIKTYKQ